MIKIETGDKRNRAGFFRHCNQRKLRSNLSLELWDNVIGSSRSKFYEQREQQMLRISGPKKEKWWC